MVKYPKILAAGTATCGENHENAVFKTMHISILETIFLNYENDPE